MFDRIVAKEKYDEVTARHVTRNILEAVGDAPSLQARTHAHTHTRRHTHIHTHTHVVTHTHTHTYTRTHTHAHTYT